MVPRLTIALGLLALSTPAFAAVDVVATITAPSGTHVYESGRWYVNVSNTGSTNASNVSVTLTLPQTGTSPGTSILGTLGAKSSGCTASGVTVTCTVGTVRGRRSATPLYFDLTLPEAAKALTLTATVSTTSAESTTARANNTVSSTASLVNYDVSFGADIDTLNRHCTGTTSLSSFYECELYPSSISEHEAVLNADGSISFPPRAPTTAAPGSPTRPITSCSSTPTWAHPSPTSKAGGSRPTAGRGSPPSPAPAPTSHPTKSASSDGVG